MKSICSSEDQADFFVHKCQNQEFGQCITSSHHHTSNSQQQLCMNITARSVQRLNVAGVTAICSFRMTLTETKDERSVWMPVQCSRYNLEQILWVWAASTLILTWGDGSGLN